MEFLENNWKKIAAFGFLVAGILYYQAKNGDSDDASDDESAEPEPKKAGRPKMGAKK